MSHRKAIREFTDGFALINRLNVQIINLIRSVNKMVFSQRYLKGLRFGYYHLITQFMKTFFTSILCLLAFEQAFCQGSVSQSTSNSQVKYWASNNGVMFSNPLPGSTGGYFIPKDSLVSAIFAMSPVIIAADINGQLKGAVAKYQSSDFFPGPIATDYNAPEFTSGGFAIAMWEMTKAAVDNHIAHYMDAGYVPHPSISAWPGNGNTANGQSLHLAPFYDYDSDDQYEPEQGDYPLMLGDKATYVILNDSKGIHPSGIDPMNLEMHLMYYQYENASDPVLTKTTFVQTTLYNRGTIALNNLRFGHIIDFDLGNPTDDYIGTSVAQQMAYVYNADLNDEPFSGHPGYGINPPAIGVISLDGNLTSNVQVQALNFPGTGTEYNYLMNGYDVDGNQIFDGSGAPTTYIFNQAGANGWNELTENNMPGDRIAASGHAVANFPPGASLVYNHAVVYARSDFGTLFSSVDSLLNVASHIQDFYDHSVSLNVGELQQSVLNVSIYPNPAKEQITVDGVTTGTYRIITSDGKEVLAGKLESPIIELDSLKRGFYLLEITSGGKYDRKSFVKE